MNLKKCLFVNNDCYRKNAMRSDIRYNTFQDRGPLGIMMHSTGANNPNISRYVAPDDGYIGINAYNNDWNRPGIDVCVHAFIGKMKDGSIATYQTMPWNFRAWHCGGDANNTHIGIEICEDNLENAEYFNAVYKEAVEVCVYICKTYSLTENDIICHSEGAKLGIASNHGDVMHWFPRYGKSMDTFRADVSKLLGRTPKPCPEPEESDMPYTTDDFVRDIQNAAAITIDGKAGSQTLNRTVTISTRVNYNSRMVLPVQKRLKALGYYTGYLDGKAERRFDEAVRAYQKVIGTYVDGEITSGKKTWRCLLGIE